MKYQKVSVDVWSMVKTMVGYLGVVLLGGLFLRLLIAVLTLPRRFAQQRESVDRAIKDLQERYPECFNQAMEEIQKEEERKERNNEKEIPKDEAGAGSRGEVEKKIN